MCVIIHKPPSVVIPEDKLTLACAINKHGFGLSYAVSGSLVIKRSSKEDNDPKKIMKILNDLNDKDVLLHLRHATVGDVTEANAHPFLPMFNKQDGMTVAFMHNGTLTKYIPKDKTISDSRWFSENRLRPLLRRFVLGTGRDKLLQDRFLQIILEEYAEPSSVFALMDSFGNVIRINESKGKEFEGWWASNDYSFDETHYRNPNKKPYTYGGIYDSNLPSYYSSWWQENDWTPLKETKTEPIVSLSDEEERKHPYTARVEEIKDACTMIQRFNRENEQKYFIGGNKMVKELTYEQLGVKHKTFLELSGLESLDNLQFLTEDNFKDMAQNYPQACALLFVDLLGERKKLFEHFGVIDVENLSEIKTENSTEKEDKK